MCVDRTASTKVPSARESRASVACQYRAAACAEMFFPNLVCVSTMLDELKLAQSEKQIYPERSGKPKDAKPGQTAGRSDFSGCRKRVFEASRSGMRRGDHQNDGGQDDPGGENCAQSDRLTDQAPAEEQCHDRIDKRVRRHPCGGAVAQNVDVGAEADPGPEEDQIAKREPGPQGDLCKMKALRFSCKQSRDHQNDPTGETLHGHAKERRTGHRAVLRIKGTTGPGEGSDHQNAGTSGIDA